jgi:hypothetical protein
MEPNHIATKVALEAVSARKWEPVPYENKKGVWGYYVHFWHAHQYHMISVHNWGKPLEPRQLSELIGRIESIDECRWGIYLNDKQVPGYYATARSAGSPDDRLEHWIMIARSPERRFSLLIRQKSRLSDEEEDLISYLERDEADPRGRY